MSGGPFPASAAQGAGSDPSCDAALEPRAIVEGLGASVFAANIRVHLAIDSTHRLAKDLAGQAAAEGTLVLAEEQTAGRGRSGRTWHSPRYANLLASILLRPGLPAAAAFALTMALGLAAADSLAELAGLKAKIKWPNDLFVGGKKLGGLLTELSVKGRRVEYAILSLGLNVNWNPGREMGPLYPATSILAETGRTISRSALVVDLLKRFEVSYAEVRAGRTSGLRRRWEEASLVLGRRVVLEGDGQRLEGTVVSVDSDGTLVLRTAGQEERRIRWGDVSLRVGEQAPVSSKGCEK